MNLFLKALVDHYNSKISEAVATLNIYMNNSVGIGEHSDILEELKKYVDILDDADSKLATLQKYIPVNNPLKYMRTPPTTE
jgi:hypothetical protein